ncbi:hypothetical protein PCC9214_02458 [Planktothrix tepida]|uniref:DUF3352 domain-containing protein n=1 Tax=Planktothrix tepida PCC 9214 TaxID=671072 RepID=A0A1J1LJ21_9CYAN|nr:DUF3352 domain-containing protein [Planktothrix tepida]CAD5949466.1 hypothetical protein PCC9214_02458 [Planktothrix tepida]CUR32503.1 conserved exported hypothetical protein [Planktothrix tepida PCC 9214]
MLIQKKSKLFLVVAAIACVGSIATFIYLTHQRYKAYSSVETGKVVPGEAIMATFVSPTPRALSELQNFGTPETQGFIRQGIQAFQQQSLAGTAINFNRDIQPWIGGVMVALLPRDPVKPASEPQLLMVVGIKNQWKAWLFAQKLKASSDIQTQQSQYRGITLSHYLEKSGKQYHVAVVNDQLVIAASAEPVKRAIDTFRGSPSLVSLSGQSHLFLKSANLSHPLVTVLIGDYDRFTKEMATTWPEASPLSLSSLSPLTSIQSIILAVGVEPEGLRVKAIAQLRPTATISRRSPEFGEMVNRFPTETLAFVNSHDLHQLWLQFLSLGKNNPALENLSRQIRLGLQAIDLDADTDVFGWMDGEFALGAIASEKGVLAALGLGGVLLIETSDRPAAERMLNKLDAIIANSNPPINIEQNVLAGIEVTEWNDPKQGTLFGHGWLSPNLMFVAFGGPVVEAITQKPQHPLNQSQQFQSISKFLPSPHHSYVYLDMEKITAWAMGYLLASPAISLQPNRMTMLNSIQGLGISATFPDVSTVEVEMVLVLKPKS